MSVIGLDKESISLSVLGSYRMKEFKQGNNMI